MVTRKDHSFIKCAVVLSLVCICLEGGEGKVRHQRSKDATASPRDDHLTTYTLGFLPALSGRRGQHKHYVGAFIHAINRMNDRPELKRQKIKLDYLFNDTKSDVRQAIRSMTYQHDKNVVAFIGPEETCETEATVAAAWDVPMISYTCGDSVLSAHSDTIYTTFARTIPSTSKVSKSLIALMKKYDWKSFYLVVGNRTSWEEAADTVTAMAKKHDIAINGRMTFTEPYKDDDIKEMGKIVIETKMKTRIYAFLGDDHALIDFAREIEDRQGINNDGRYVIVAVHDRPYSVKDKEKYILKYFERGDSFSKKVVNAFQSVLILLPQGPKEQDKYEIFEDKTRNYSYKYEPFGVPEPIFADLKMEVPPYAAYLYDAVFVYTQGLLRALAEKINIKNGTEIMKLIRNNTYPSICEYNFNIDENGDAEANYTVVALKGDNGEPPFFKSMQKVGRFITTGGELPEYEEYSSIDWRAGQVITSNPECGFDDSGCRFNPDWPTAVICTVAASVVLILTVCACRHYIYEQKLASLLWKMDYKDIILTEGDLADPLMSEKTKRRAHGRYSHLSNEETREEAKMGRQNGGIRVASYKGTLVAVRMLKKRHVEITRAVRKELHLLKEMTHDNINRFLGACVDPPNICIITQYCARGSLKDILENDDLHLDEMFIASLVFDLIRGMIYIHDSEIGSHGNLKSSNCLVDSRWVLQIADFGLHHFKSAEVPNNINEDSYYSRLMCKAPELLRDPYAPPQGSQKGDVYSFAMVLFEIHGRCGPWGPTVHTPREIIEKVKKPYDGWQLRPDTSLLKCEDFVIKCIEDCWHDDPEYRPDFKFIRFRLKPMQKGMRSNIFDNMLAIMEKYANNLEAIVAERTDQLMEEKKKTEALLHRMLPRSVAEQLKRGKKVIPEMYECVTIYFSDIVGFTSISAESTPMQVVDMLNDLYTIFDSIIHEYDVYKVETIGDAYMVVSGLPIRNGDNHAGEIASMSLHLLSAIKTFKIAHRPDDQLNLRIGLHSGPCVVGVVGLIMPRYCLFGDTVNTASRMESTGVPLKIHCSQECKDILDKLQGYILDDRGFINMKGKGQKFTYFLTGEDKSERLRRISVGKKDDTRTTPCHSLSRLNKQSSVVTSSTASLMSASSKDSIDADHVNIFMNGNVKYMNDSSRMFEV